MIWNFADSEAALIWSGRRSRKLPADIQAVALRKLRLLNQCWQIFGCRRAIALKR